MSRIKVFTAVTLSISLLLGPTSPVLSQIYSWTDEQGRRQISDRPPEAAVPPPPSELGGARLRRQLHAAQPRP